MDVILFSDTGLEFPQMYEHLNKLEQYTWEATQEELETDLIYDGILVISDPLSPDVYGAIGRCRKAGIEV